MVRSTTRSHRRSTLVVALAAGLTALVSAGPLATAAEAADRTVRVSTLGPNLNVRSAPTTSGGVMRTLKDGASVTITCYATGTPVVGPYGVTTTVWDRLSTGGYVSDAFLYTGSDQPVVGRCGGAATPPPASGKAGRAVAWAKSQIGSSAYHFQCQRFVENAYNTSGHYPSAIATFYSLQAAGQIRTTGTPPAGALVFSKSAYDGGFGHVALSVGDGTYISGGMPAPSTVRTTSSPNPSPGATYLGWAAAPSGWPSR